MKGHLVMANLAVFLLGVGAASAQVGGPGPSALGATSPLSMGSGMQVAPTGIPLGATEMATPGTSPAPSADLGCASAAGPTSQSGTSLFDGGGMAGAASGACATTGGAGSSMPVPARLATGRAGIPLGSTEIGNLGLSPPPPVSTTFVPLVMPPFSSPLTTLGSPPSAAAAPPCPVTGAFSDSATVRGARSSAATAGMSGC
jgi:hypothetical protein